MPKSTNQSLPAELTDKLFALTKEERESIDSYGNGYSWFILNSAWDLPRVAAILADYKARLCTVTALANQKFTDPIVFVAYHFDVQGYTLTLTVPLDPQENSIPSITPWFRNADWNEREFAELYDVHVTGNTNPKRLFLDSDIDEGILNEIIPLTVLMNGACTTDLWEKLMLANSGESKE